MKRANPTMTLARDTSRQAMILMGVCLTLMMAFGMRFAFAQVQDPLAASTAAVPAAPAPVADAVPVAPTAVDVTAAPVAAAPAAPTVAPAAVPVTTATSGSTNNTVNMPSTPLDLPPGAPSSLAGVVRDLQQAQKNVSVDDMVRAEDAIARLDLLIKIQSKLGELKKAQEEANESSNMQFAGGMGMPAGMPAGGAVGQIPASALSLPTGAMAAPVMPARPVRSSESSTSYKVERISGANGNFNAVLVDPDGERKIVRIGDKVGSREVSNISAEGVQLRGAKGAIKTLAVQNNGIALSPFSR